MSRWPEQDSRYHPATRQTVEGDTGFKGFNNKLERSDLPTGILARSENKRLLTGAARDRKGTDYPAPFQANYTEEFAGSGIYAAPNDEEFLLVAEGGANFVWKFEEGDPPTQIPIQGTSIPTNIAVFFAQAFNTIMIMRGAGGLEPLVWDGEDPLGFKVIQKSDPADTTTLLIPTVWYGIPFANRMLYARNPLSSDIIMSDILDYTSYDPIFSVFSMNAGSADHIAALFPYSRQKVVVFMERSIRSLSNFTIPDPITGNFTQAAQDTINDQLGIAHNPNVPTGAPIVQVGGDLIFLSEPGGFYRLGEVVQQVIQSQPVPISDSIQGTIDQLDWTGIAQFGAPSQVLGIYAYFAVRLLDNPNSVLLVYNTVTGQWEAVDNFGEPNFNVDAMHVMNYQGQRRLFMLDYSNTAIYLVGEGTMDVMKSGTFPIHSIIETRGYGNDSGGGPGSIKSFRRVTAGLETAMPSTNITAIFDGYNEEKLITPTPITKDPLKNYRFGISDFNPASDDSNTPKREDYSVGGVDENVAAQDFEGIPAGDISALPPSEAILLPGLAVKQQSLERRSIRQVGRWCSIRVENFQGQCDVLGVGVESIEKQNVVRVSA